MRRIWMSIGIVVLVAAWADAGPRGIYALIGTGAAPSAHTLANPAVAGVVLVANWDALEPAPGVYAWSYFDTQVAQAQAHGKQVILAVRRGLQGDGLPAWLLRLGMQTFTCRIGGVPTVGPQFWDPVYVQAYSGLMAQLAARYGTTPTVQGLSLSYYSWQTTDWEDCTYASDDPAASRQAWIQAGWTKEGIRAGLQAIYDRMVALTVTTIQLPIAYTLDEVTGVRSMETTGYVVDGLIASGHGQLEVGRTVFDNTTPTPRQLANGTAYDAAFQYLDEQQPFIFGQRRWPYTFTPRTFARMLGIALQYRVLHFEVGEAQANDAANAPAVAIANTVMRASY